MVENPTGPEKLPHPIIRRASGDGSVLQEDDALAGGRLRGVGGRSTRHRGAGHQEVRFVVIRATDRTEDTDPGNEATKPTKVNEGGLRYFPIGAGTSVTVVMRSAGKYFLNAS